MASAPSPNTDSTEPADLIHREVVQLVGLVIVAIVAFFVTRAVAMNNRELSVRNAAEWYRQGERFRDAGRVDDAIAAFRRATVRNRTNRTYLLALSRALVEKRDYDSARSILLTIRETAPEDAEINLDLARLSAARQDVTEALRFYHDALYAPWAVDQEERRRAVRFELVGFLLGHGQSSRAQSELLAAAVNMPDDVAHQIALAHLFDQAGDDRSALAHFERALRVAPQNPEALAGAGKAAFGLGEYTLARRYLREVPDGTAGVGDISQIVEQVVSRDPTAARLGARERRQRLDANLAFVQQRFAGCLSQRGQPASAGEEALQKQLEAFTRGLQPAATLDQDTIESGLDLIDRVERDGLAACGPPGPVDRALLLIAARYRTASP
jgi:tetratricopeptide (TPR) repeat protein